MRFHLSVKSEGFGIGVRIMAGRRGDRGPVVNG